MTSKRSVLPKTPNPKTKEKRTKPQTQRKQQKTPHQKKKTFFCSFLFSVFLFFFEI